MYASVQYLLCGLPVVTTASRGGRDEFFDPESTIECEPSPAAVAEAVRHWRRADVDRAGIRCRVLARIVEHRRVFMTLGQCLVDEHGGARRFGHGFAMTNKLMRWESVRSIVSRPPERL